MGYDVAMIAAAELPAKALRAWQEHQVVASRFDDWPAPLSPRGAPDATVRRVLAELPRHLPDTPCEVDVEGARIEIAAVLPGHVFTEHGARLAAAVRLVAAHGGRARLDFVGYLTSALAVGFLVTPATTRVFHHGEAAARKVERMAIYRWLDARMQRRSTTARPSIPKAWLRTAPQDAPAPAARPARARAGTYDVIVSGRLQFPGRQCARWLRQAAPVISSSGW